MVLCFKWGTAYPSVYANVLYRACRDHGPGHRFVCLTDDATGLDPGIDALPLPDLALPDGMVARGGWPKLSVFDTGLGLSGRVLCLDVDLVICGSLAPFFDAIGPAFAGGDGESNGGPDCGSGVTAMREPPKPLERLIFKPHRGANTSAFGFMGGTQGQILDRFRADPAGALARHRIEQAHVSAEATRLRFWPGDLIVSFKYALNPPRPLRGRVAPGRPGAGTSIVAFHGYPNPTDLLDAGRGREGFDGHGGYSAWVHDYWQRYGGPVGPA